MISDPAIEKINKDPELQQNFKANPRQTLADLGLDPEEVELHRHGTTEVIGDEELDQVSRGVGICANCDYPAVSREWQKRFRFPASSRKRCLYPSFQILQAIGSFAIRFPVLAIATALHPMPHCSNNSQVAHSSFSKSRSLFFISAIDRNSDCVKTFDNPSGRTFGMRFCRTVSV